MAAVADREGSTPSEVEQQFLDNLENANKPFSKGEKYIERIVCVANIPDSTRYLRRNNCR